MFANKMMALVFISLLPLTAFAMGNHPSLDKYVAPKAQLTEEQKFYRVGDSVLATSYLGNTYLAMIDEINFDLGQIRVTTDVFYRSDDLLATTTYPISILSKYESVETYENFTIGEQALFMNDLGSYALITILDLTASGRVRVMNVRPVYEHLSTEFYYEASRLKKVEPAQ